MTIIDQIVASPRMPVYVQELNEILAAERAERDRFYAWLPDDKKAEFINGKVFVHSPVKFEHEDVSSNLFVSLRTYVRRHDLGHTAHEKLLVTLTRNDYEPDIAFWGKAKAAKFKKGQMQFPAPDLVVEVLSPSTVRHDRKVKFEDYATHGVDEYWIVDPDHETTEQYFLTRGMYEPVLGSKGGLIKSRAIKGFEIPVRAVFDAHANVKALAAIMRH